MDWFLYDKDLRHEIVKTSNKGKADDTELFLNEWRKVELVVAKKWIEIKLYTNTFSSFMTEVPIIKKPVHFCSANQWIGFFMIVTSFLKELMVHQNCSWNQYSK